ncbi:MAG TPA: glutathione synthase [Polyangiaceae bacterium]|nr:glutathione synthase [Polyangiaceae bacterium]
MRILFVMDPAEIMISDKDTSFAFMRGALARGHETLHCLPVQVHNYGREVFADARSIRVSDSAPHVQLGRTETVDLSGLDAVFVRKDPPFDAAYLHLTQQLDLVKDRTLVVNDPNGLRDANEKLFTFHFTEFMPRSLVCSSRERMLEFLSDVGGQAVLKPLDGAGGSGVVALTHGDRNTRALIDLLTQEGRSLALIQEYQSAVTEGDKRVLVLDGEPLGAILRVPRADDLRANIHVGGTVKPTELTAAELTLVRSVGEKLRKHGLWFVGLDLIGEKLIEVNVTSPTGIQELARFQGRPTEQDVIAWVERRVTG